jgi:hypothetical protein
MGLSSNGHHTCTSNSIGFEQFLQCDEDTGGSDVRNA